ncbi:MAG: hypothetical protein R2818_07065 [Flavobacteriales bacterium]
MQIILSLAFALGLFFKLLHLPYHTVYLLTVVCAGLVISLFKLVRSEEKSAAVAILASWTWCLYVVALLKLFSFRNSTLLFAFACSALAILLYRRLRFRLDRPLQVLSGVFVLSMLISSRPASERYYFTNLTFSLERDTDFRSWDKYSFLLMRDGDMQGALAAGRAAINALHQAGRNDLLPLLEGHAKAIENGDWPVYSPLPF